jgi:hypothetical protein
MGVAATDDIAPFSRCVLLGIGLDFLSATKKDLTLLLGEFGKVVGRVDLLQVIVNAVGKPGQDRVARDKLIETMAVQEEDPGFTTLNDNLIGTGHAKQMGNDLGRAIVVAVNPGDFNLVGKFPNGGQNSPVLFLQSPEVNRVEDVAIENQTFGRHETMSD